jgi:hypothetical protein
LCGLLWAVVRRRSLPGAPRTFNFCLNGRQVGAGGDINRIADQLAEMLEREHKYSRR